MPLAELICYLKSLKQTTPFLSPMDHDANGWLDPRTTSIPSSKSQLGHIQTRRTHGRMTPSPLFFLICFFMHQAQIHKCMALPTLEHVPAALTEMAYSLNGIL